MTIVTAILNIIEEENHISILSGQKKVMVFSRCRDSKVTRPLFSYEPQTNGGKAEVRYVRNVVVIQ